MRNLKVEILNRLPNSLVFMLFFLMAFYLVPKIYFENLDNTEYFKIYTVSIEDSGSSFKPCESIVVSVDRESKINAHAQSVREFVQVFDQNSEYEISRETINGALDKGRRTISIKVDLPCEIPNGNYLIRFVVEYQVRGITKTTSWSTPLFIVES